MKVFSFFMVVALMTIGAINVNAQTTAKQVKNANAAEFRKLISGNDVVVIDVRTPREFAAGKIEGAINVPLNTVAKSAAKLDKSKKYLVYCRSGARSRRAAMILARQGFDVTNLMGGMRAWNRR